MKLIAILLLVGFIVSNGLSQTHPGSHSFELHQNGTHENLRMNELSALLQSSLEKRDSSNYYYWNTSTQSYDFLSHSTFRYDGNSVIRYGYNNLYELGGRDSIVYDINGNVLEYFNSFRTGDTWWEFLHFSYQYNDQGDIVEFVHREDNGGGLYNKSRTLYHYDTNGLLIEELDLDWLSGMDDWGNNRRQTYVYNSNNLLDTTLLEVWSWAFDEYQVVNRETFMYGSDQELLLRQIERIQNNLWMIIGRTLYTYDGSIRVVTIEGNTFSEGNWIPSAKTLYTYDENDNPLSITGQSFADSTWVDEYRTVYGYTAENNILTEVYQEFYDTWHSVDSIQNYYNTISRLEDHTKPIEVVFFPNPVSNVLQWSIEEGFEASHFYAYNLTGQLVESTRLNATQNHVDLSSLDAGLYLIEIVTDQGKVRSIVVKQ